MKRLETYIEFYFVFYRPYFDAKLKAENELKVNRNETDEFQLKFSL
jgi:hypothetical protein